MPTAVGITNLLIFSIFIAMIQVLDEFILALLCADVEFLHVVCGDVKCGESTFS
jgi:hypothetical protein